jgi:hypothetical protein
MRTICPNFKFLSGFQMVLAAISFLPFENQTGHFLTSLVHFVMNKIFFMTLFFIKRSRLATIRIPDKKVRFSNGPVFKCPIPGIMDHSNTGLVRYSVVDCIKRSKLFFGNHKKIVKTYIKNFRSDL